MVKYNQLQLDTAFQALSDHTRRDILERLSRKNLRASELAHHYRISFPAVSKHLKILEKSHLVHRTKVGREHIFSLERKRLEYIKSWLQFYTDYWNQQLDRLDTHLKGGEKNGKL
jgi:DNA-binding transcriptional ArsR family regulator